MSKGTHFSASTDLEIQWAQWVRELVPCAEKVRFHSSGTEADMMAMRMARAHTGKTKVIKFENHFHGWSDYAMAGSQGIGGIPGETLGTMVMLPAATLFSFIRDPRACLDDSKERRYEESGVAGSLYPS